MFKDERKIISNFSLSVDFEVSTQGPFKNRTAEKIQQLRPYAVWCHQIHSKWKIQETTHLADVGSDFSETTPHKTDVI